MTIKQKMDTARMKAARILVKALFTAATEDDAADHSSEKSRPAETGKGGGVCRGALPRADAR